MRTSAFLPASSPTSQWSNVRCPLDGPILLTTDLSPTGFAPRQRCSCSRTIRMGSQLRRESHNDRPMPCRGRRPREIPRQLSDCGCDFGAAVRRGRHPDIVDVNVASARLGNPSGPGGAPPTHRLPTRVSVRQLFAFSVKLRFRICGNCPSFLVANTRRSINFNHRVCHRAVLLL